MFVKSNIIIKKLWTTHRILIHNLWLEFGGIIFRSCCWSDIRRCSSYLRLLIIIVITWITTIFNHIIIISFLDFLFLNFFSVGVDLTISDWCFLTCAFISKHFKSSFQLNLIKCWSVRWSISSSYDKLMMMMILIR